MSHQRSPTERVLTSMLTRRKFTRGMVCIQSRASPHTEGTRVALPKALPLILTEAAQSMAANQKEHHHQRRLQATSHNTNQVTRHPILANPCTRHPPPPPMGLRVNPPPNQDTVLQTGHPLVIIQASHRLTNTPSLTKTRSLTRSPVHPAEHPHQVT